MTYELALGQVAEAPKITIMAGSARASSLSGQRGFHLRAPVFATTGCRRDRRISGAMAESIFSGESVFLPVNRNRV